MNQFFYCQIYHNLCVVVGWVDVLELYIAHEYGGNLKTSHLERYILSLRYVYIVEIYAKFCVISCMTRLKSV
jgi:hypothetical protein